MLHLVTSILFFKNYYQCLCVSVVFYICVRCCVQCLRSSKRVISILMTQTLLFVLQKLGADGTMEWSENQGACEIHYR